MERKRLRKAKVGLIVLVILCILSIWASATPVDVNVYGGDFLIDDDDDYGTVNVYNDANVTMIGGDAYSVWSYNSSTLQLQGGRVSEYISAHNESSIIMSGGLTGDLELFDSTVASISGGEITGHLATAQTSTVHIYGKNFDFTPHGSGGPGWITGNWADDTPFTIYYRNYEPFPGSHLVLHTIPEPGTFCLFGIVSLFLRKRARIFCK